MIIKRFNYVHFNHLTIKIDYYDNTYVQYKILYAL